MAFNNAMRSVLPDLLALSASSPWYEGRRTHLHSTRTQLFTRMFPRCGIPEPFDGWADYDRFVRWLVETRSIKEHTEIWWCVRPHQSYGTVELRNADALADVRESLAVMAYAYALSARRLRAIDEGEPLVELRGRHIEENMWRAIRWGMSGELIDYERGMASVPAAERVLAQLADAAPEVAALGLEPYLEPLHRMLEGGNSAQRSIAALESGRDARGAVRRSGPRDARVGRRGARAGGGPWLRTTTITITITITASTTTTTTTAGDPAGDDMRAMLAQQLLQLRPRDLLAQTAVMLANQAAIRLGMASPEHADREQAREAIDALAGVVELLAPLSPPEEVEALRRDLAQLRMAYVQSAPPAPPAGRRRPRSRPRTTGPARSARRSGRPAARSSRPARD